MAAIAVSLVVAITSTAGAAAPAALEGQLGPGVSVIGGAETEANVTFIGTDRGRAIPLDASAPRSAALEAAGRFAASFGLRGEAELEVGSVERLAGGRSVVELRQTLGGLPVIGGELKANLDPAGDLLSLGGELTPRGSVDTTPSISAAAATATALASVAKEHGVEVTGLSAAAGELAVYDPRILGAPDPLGPRPVWRFEVEGGTPVAIRELVLVDAELGNVALDFSQIHAAKNRRVCDAGEAEAKLFCLGEAAARIEGGGPHAQPEVNAAYDLSGAVYDFYSTRFGRDSIDDAGMPLVSTVRFCEGGCPFHNAFWNGEQMTFGPGWATDDILAHELTHGVVEDESHLFYYYQSGAINESLADIFGELFDLSHGSDPPTDRWLVSEESPIGAIRDMADPPAFGDPDRMRSPSWRFDPEASFESGDAGGVHTNSGVGNKAAYLLTDGASFNGQTVGALGAEKTLRLYYEVNANLLTSAGDYQDLGNGLRQACATLTGQHGIVAADCAQVDRAVLATEMDSPPADPSAAPRTAALCGPGQAVVPVYSDDLETPAGEWTISNSIPVGGAGGFFYPQNSHPFGEFDATYATSGTTNIWGYDFPQESDSGIAMTESIAVPNGGRLHFNHAFGFESEESAGESFNYDGGVIEYTVDGGASWEDAGDLIAAGADYGGTLQPGNPIGAREGFVGESGGYGSTRLDLSSLAGQGVRFRFRIATDFSVGDYGWFIDDVRIYHCDGETDPPPEPEPEPDPPLIPVTPNTVTLNPWSPPVEATPAPAMSAPKPRKARKCGRKQRRVRIKVKVKGEVKVKVRCVGRKGKRKKRS